MTEQSDSPLKFFDPVILRKSAIVDNSFVLKNHYLPLPSIVELSPSGTCNRTCVFCPRSDPTYPDVEEFWADAVEAFRTEVAELAKAGCRHIQLDECMMPFLCDPRHREMVRSRGEDPDALMERYAKVNNDIVNPRPDSVVATIHLSRRPFSAVPTSVSLWPLP